MPRDRVTRRSRYAGHVAPDDSALADSEIDGYTATESLVSGYKNNHSYRNYQFQELRSPQTPVSWHSPSSRGFIQSYAEKLRISISCRFCGKKPSPHELIMCGNCLTRSRAAHRECLLSRGHRLDPEPNGPDGSEESCEELEFVDFIFTKWFLDPNTIGDPSIQHQKDAACTWIGVPVVQTQKYPRIHIWPRLHDILKESQSPHPRQCPSLVSFIGSTGAGKSTLIRAMVHMVRPDEIYKQSVPIPGLPTDRFDSTSSDIHVYADPHTLPTRSPILYLDCEGLAGSVNPISRQYLTAREHRIRSGEDSNDPEYLEDFVEASEDSFDLRWGGWENVPHSTTSHLREERKTVAIETRKTVVKRVYPRILYAFSDVVCFVTTNGRESHNFLSKLIAWATEGHERVLNQRVKPALIIIINKDHDSTDSAQDEQEVTSNLLLSFQRTEEYNRLRNSWEERGNPIESAADLLHCYYSSFRVLTIPVHRSNSSPSNTIDVYKSIKSVYNAIQTTASDVRKRKEEKGVEFDVADLNKNIKKSLHCLGRDQRSSLDFYGLTEGDSPVPTRFSEHMRAMMVKLGNEYKIDRSDEIGGEQRIANTFAEYGAACIAAQLPWGQDQATIKRVRDSLVDEARLALEVFHNRNWRCEARNQRGKRCKNYLPGHEKGHQFSSRALESDEISATDDVQVADYVCSWRPTEFREQLVRGIHALRSKSEAMEKLRILAHQKRILPMHSQRTCLTCLSECPTNILPCRHRDAGGPGHGICRTCLERFSDYQEHKHVLTIDRCPLGCELYSGPQKIRVKPKSAAPRILSLDGGGVRGIIELAIMNAISYEIAKQVPLSIPLYELFDLVVGTSTGGIIALGVFHEGWHSKSNIGRFQSLVTQAFSYRAWLHLPLTRPIIQQFCNYRYTNKGIENSLKDRLGTRSLFSSKIETPPDQANRERHSSARRGHPCANNVKVAVVSSVQDDNRTILISNYFRNPDSKNGYDQLSRQEDQSEDFRIWEAARATSAIPHYYKPFGHPQTKEVYINEEIEYKNPVQLAYSESKKIWGDTHSPDIILSLGTGALVNATSGRIQDQDPGKGDILKDMVPPAWRNQSDVENSIARRSNGCYQTWLDFMERNPQLSAKKCHRIDVGLVERVDIDEVEKMKSIREQCRQYLSRSERAPRYFNPKRYGSAYEHIKVVTRRLLASLFHYSGTDLNEILAGGKFQGRIYCRLTPGETYTTSFLSSNFHFQLQQTCRETKDTIPTPIRFLDGSHNFDNNEMAATVALEVTSGAYDRSIEVRLPIWPRWEPISGF